MITRGADVSEPLKVMSWNLHHGAGLDGKLDLARIAAFIKKQDADVVALQEVDNQCNRSENIDQAAELAKLTGLHGAFGAAMPYDGGQYGLAILSKHPIGKTQVIRLPGDGEPRIGFLAEIQAPQGSITLVSTHFHHRSGESRIAQAKELLAALAKTSGPIVIAGDLNDVLGSPPLSLFTEPWLHVKKKNPVATCPADHPKSEIDHFFVRGLQPVKEAEVLEEAISSDHRPIIATLAITKP
jgi:Metal-dependent hydrolase